MRPGQDCLGACNRLIGNPMRNLHPQASWPDLRNMTRDRPASVSPQEGSTYDAQRRTAARIMEVFPLWLVMWGVYTRQYWAYPCFDAEQGTILHARDPNDLAGVGAICDQGGKQGLIWPIVGLGEGCVSFCRPWLWEGWRCHTCLDGRCARPSRGRAAVWAAVAGVRVLDELRAGGAQRQCPAPASRWA